MTRILYLHGFASSPSSRKAQHFREALQQAGAQIEIPDLAEGDFEHLTITGQLAVIERAAGGAPVSLIGSSMGGYLAALYAARHPEVVRLVLLAPGFAFRSRWPEYLGAEKVEQYHRNGFIEVYHYAERQNRRLSSKLRVDITEYEDFPDFRQPALIFHGRNDAVVPVERSREFAEAHPNVRLQVLDSGHELVDVLDDMTPRVIDFLV